MRTLYFDCFAGASGNMILGGLVSLGVDPIELEEEIKRLDIADFDIVFKEVDRAGINSVYAKTLYRKEKHHRHLSNIKDIITRSELTDLTTDRSIKIFTNLAKAEAKVHGTEIEKVHFHEVGSMDAIIDVVGACIGFELLKIEKFICSKINTGNGFTEMIHGKYPVPAPAVGELLKGASIYSNEIEGELITPTGAAIVSTICSDFGEMPEIKLKNTGYGAGTREYKKFPNVLRLILGTSKSRSENAENIFSKNKGLKTKIESESLYLIETNLDDISAEILGYVMEKAFEMGALDFWFTPIQMKKNRPATMVSVLCKKEKKDGLSEMLFSETTTLGVRISKTKRKCLPRETNGISTEFGDINVKISRYGEKIIKVKPEYESMRKIALESGLSIGEIEKRILSSLKTDKEEEN